MKRLTHRAIRLAVAMSSVMPVASAEAPVSNADRCWTRGGELYGVEALAERAPTWRPPRRVLDVVPKFPRKSPPPGCAPFDMDVLVSPSGKVEAVWPPSPSVDACRKFVDPAEAAIRQWKYEELVIKERPVAWCLTIRMNIDVP
jgi:hypothetical protein